MATRQTSEFPSRYSGNEKTGYAVEHQDEELNHILDNAKERVYYEGPASDLDHRVSFLNGMEEQMDNLPSLSDRDMSSRDTKAMMDHRSNMEMTYAIINSEDDNLAHYSHEDREAFGETLLHSFNQANFANEKEREKTAEVLADKVIGGMFKGLESPAGRAGTGIGYNGSMARMEARGLEAWHRENLKDALLEDAGSNDSSEVRDIIHSAHNVVADATYEQGINYDTIEAGLDDPRLTEIQLDRFNTYLWTDRMAELGFDDEAALIATGGMSDHTANLLRDAAYNKDSAAFGMVADQVASAEPTGTIAMEGYTGLESPRAFRNVDDIENYAQKADGILDQAAATEGAMNPDHLEYARNMVEGLRASADYIRDGMIGDTATNMRHMMAETATLAKAVSYMVRPTDQN